MSKNTKKKLAAVMFCKFDEYDKYVSNDKQVAAKILTDYNSILDEKVTKYQIVEFYD